MGGRWPWITHIAARLSTGGYGGYAPVRRFTWDLDRVKRTRGNRPTGPSDPFSSNTRGVSRGAPARSIVTRPVTSGDAEPPRARALIPAERCTDCTLFLRVICLVSQSLVTHGSDEGQCRSLNQRNARSSLKVLPLFLRKTARTVVTFFCSTFREIAENSARSPRRSIVVLEMHKRTRMKYRDYRNKNFISSYDELF